MLKLRWTTYLTLKSCFDQGSSPTVLPISNLPCRCSPRGRLAPQGGSPRRRTRAPPRWSLRASHNNRHRVAEWCTGAVGGGEREGRGPIYQTWLVRVRYRHTVGPNRPPGVAKGASGFKWIEWHHHWIAYGSDNGPLGDRAGSHCGGQMWLRRDGVAPSRGSAGTVMLPPANPTTTE